MDAINNNLSFSSEVYCVTVISRHALWLLPPSLLSPAWQWQQSHAGWLRHMRSVCVDGGGLCWITNLHGAWNRGNEPVLWCYRYLLLQHPLLVHLLWGHSLTSALRSMREQPCSPSWGKKGTASGEVGPLYRFVLGANVSVLASWPPREAAPRRGNKEAARD